MPASPFAGGFKMPKRGTAMLPRLSWRSKETFGAYMITAARAIARKPLCRFLRKSEISYVSDLQDKHTASSSFLVCVGESCLNPIAKIVGFCDSRLVSIGFLFAFEMDFR